MDNLVSMNNVGTETATTAPTGQNVLQKDHVDVQEKSSGNMPGLETKPYTLRRLNSSDLFLTIKLIGKIGLDDLVAALDKELLKKLMGRTKNENKDENGDVQDENGDVQAERSVAGVEVFAKLAGKILERIPVCQNEIYMLLSSVSGIAVKELEVMDMGTFTEMFFELVTMDGFRDFFGVASKYIGLLG